MKLEFSRQIFEKHSHIKFHENPSNRSRAVPCGRTGGRTGGRTDVTKLIVVFRNSANVPKNSAANTRITYYSEALWTVLPAPFPDVHTSQSSLPIRLYRSLLFAHYTMLLLLLRPVITFYYTHYYCLCLCWLRKICRLYITSNLHILEIFCNY